MYNSDETRGGRPVEDRLVEALARKVRIEALDVEDALLEWETADGEAGGEARGINRRHYQERIRKSLAAIHDMTELLSSAARDAG